MQEYVLIFANCLQEPDKVLLVYKTKRPFYGKYNLLGGKIKVEETPLEAAQREFQEEAGINANNFEFFGKIDAGISVIYCYRVSVFSQESLNPNIEEEEDISWYRWDRMKTNPSLMTNLQIIIPLFQSGVKDWTVIDQTLVAGNSHKIDVSLKVQ